MCNKIEQKFNNGLDLKITIEDLFKIIDYDKDKEELSIKIKKLKLLIQNLRLSYNEKLKNNFDKLIKTLEEYDNLEKEIIDISSLLCRYLIYFEGIYEIRNNILWS